MSPLCQADANFAVETLNQALRLANEEVMNLRRQCEELRSHSRMPNSIGVRSRNSQPHNDRDTSSSNPENKTQSQNSQHIPDEIAALTGEEAKDALTVRGLMTCIILTSCMNLKVNSSYPVTIAILSSRRHCPARGLARSQPGKYCRCAACLGLRQIYGRIDLEKIYTQLQP